MELRTLYVYGKFKNLCSVFVNCFNNSYAGASFQLVIGLIDVFDLCSFIVACRQGAVGFMHVYFHTFLLCLRIVLVHFISFW
jgi:hypothetical protein